FVSSANLALERVSVCGTVDAQTPVVVNHTDCDSVLSSGIASGLLEPDAEYGAAAIAADHTGAEHPIADLLQALGPARDLELSFRALAQLRSGVPLGREARRALDDRRRMRGRAEEAVSRGHMNIDGPLAWGVFE